MREAERAETTHSDRDRHANDGGARQDAPHDHAAHDHAAHDHAAHDHAAHGGAGHDKHAGHSPAMFRDRLLVSVLLTLPVLYFSSQLQSWLGYAALAFPGAGWVNPVLGTALFFYGGAPFLRVARTRRAGRAGARHGPSPARGRPHRRGAPVGAPRGGRGAGAPGRAGARRRRGGRRTLERERGVPHRRVAAGPPAGSPTSPWGQG